jgi:sarcosine oxidase subunit alpha
MLAGVPVAQDIMVRVARKLAGLGELPSKPAREAPVLEALRTSVLVVGGGCAGLAAAKVLAQGNVPFVLLEREPYCGGRRVAGASGTDAPHLSTSNVRAHTTALGLYEDESGRFVVAVDRSFAPRLVAIHATRFLFTLGGRAEPCPFGSNDLPGVFSGKAAATLLRLHRVRVGDTVVLTGMGSEMYALATLLREMGATIAAIVDLGGEIPRAWESVACHGEPVTAFGRFRVRGLKFRRRDGTQGKVRCDALIVSMPLTPNFELAREGGAEVEFDPRRGTFVVIADADGRTAAKDVYVAGDATGESSIDACASAGERAATAIAKDLA